MECLPASPSSSCIAILLFTLPFLPPPPLPPLPPSLYPCSCPSLFFSFISPLPSPLYPSHYRPFSQSRFLHLLLFLLFLLFLLLLCLHFHLYFSFPSIISHSLYFLNAKPSLLIVFIILLFLAIVSFIRLLLPTLLSSFHHLTTSLSLSLILFFFFFFLLFFSLSLSICFVFSCISKKDLD